MADALDNIFSAIYQSEIIAQQEKQKCQEVKNEIKYLKSSLAKQTEQYILCEERRSTLEIELAEASLGMSIVKAKEKGLNNRLKLSKDHLAVEKSKQMEVKTKMIDVSNKFITRVKQFSTQYNLDGSGIDKRTQIAKEQLKVLNTQKTEIDADIIKIKDCNAELKKILDKKLENRKYLDSISNQTSDLEKQLEVELKFTTELENSLSGLVSEPNVGSDFIAVREELEQYEVTDLQSEINQWQLELNSLNKILKRKESHSLRMQFRNWQRRQHQQSNTNTNTNNINNTTGSSNSNSNSMKTETNSCGNNYDSNSNSRRLMNDEDGESSSGVLVIPDSDEEMMQLFDDEIKMESS